MYRWLDHTGELELEIEAPTEAAVFHEALAAIGELLGEDSEGEPPEPGDAPASRDGLAYDLAFEEPDRPRLLAAFLAELAFLAESERFVPVGIERLAFDEGRLQATVRGRIGEPPHLVKAVTLHRLGFDAVDGGWRATAVLDV